MKHTHIIILGLLGLSLTACEKDKATDTTGTFANAEAIVLNEGNFGSNDASLSALDITHSAIENSWFEKANGRGLGNQAQDIVRYNGKLYVTVTESNTLEAIDPATGAAIQKSMGSLKPRHIATDGGKLYISCYNPPCVVRVDAATLAIEDTCILGAFKPEGIAIAQGKAFVASAYNDSYQYDNKVYVVPLAEFPDTAKNTVTVGTNNNKVEKINDSKVILSYVGNYGDIPSGAAIIDAATLAVTPVGHGLTKMTVYNGKVYGYDAPYGGTPSWVVINADGTVEDFPFAVPLASPYALAVNPANGDFIITEADYGISGDIHCFRPDGTLRFKLEAGTYPGKVVFLND